MHADGNPNVTIYGVTTGYGHQAGVRLEVRRVDRRLAVVDYEPMSALDIEALPPVAERSAQPFETATE